MLLVPLIGIGLAYVLGYRRLSRLSHTASSYRTRGGLFIVGYTALVVALLSPLHALGEAYFSVHMVQHLLLSLVAPPLLLLSNSFPVMLWALPRHDRLSVGRLLGQPGPIRSGLRWLMHPVIAWALFVGTQWVWHLPIGYNWALENRWAHYLEHLSFFATAIIFWWPVIGSAPLRSPLNFPARLAYTFLAWMPNSLLGAGLTLSRGVLYPHYIQTAQTSAIDPAVDQQLAGLIMWVPGDLLFAIILILLLVAFMRNEEHRAERIDRELDARDAATQLN